MGNGNEDMDGCCAPVGTSNKDDDASSNFISAYIIGSKRPCVSTASQGRPETQTKCITAAARSRQPHLEEHYNNLIISTPSSPIANHTIAQSFESKTNLTMNEPHWMTTTMLSWSMLRKTNHRTRTTNASPHHQSFHSNHLSFEDDTYLVVI